MKRILSLIALLFLFTSSAHAAIVCVAGGAGCTSTTPVSWNLSNGTTACTGGTATSPSYTPTAGNTVFILAIGAGTTAPTHLTFSDSKGDTCSIVKKFTGTVVGDPYVAMCVNVAGGATTFTLTTTSGTGQCTVSGQLLEVSGLGSAPIEDTDSSTGTGSVSGIGQTSQTTIISGTTANTTVANEIALTIGLTEGSNIATGPLNSFNNINTTSYTQNSTITVPLSAYEIVSSTGNWHTSWTVAVGRNADAGVLTMEPVIPTATPTPSGYPPSLGQPGFGPSSALGSQPTGFGGNL